jgi:hypothetical protein
MCDKNFIPPSLSGFPSESNSGKRSTPPPSSEPAMNKTPSRSPRHVSLFGPR